ncbi:hypothetical protein [Pseudoxanthomonas sp.]|jgi:hypothetical protein|uniref:hypothetical protein n=1 Tax=Pseudoxanthomonas sp. TaxID=1871049 RepID=UPI002E149215|nr:hypothetical protein [Pseudoxanthomonas sp.]
MATIQKTKTVTATRCHLKVVGSRIATDRHITFAINGEFVALGSIVEVSMDEATDLVARGLAVDATEQEVEAAGEDIVISPSRNETWRDA